MAIYRNVSMSFWTDSKVADDFTPEDKYLYLYLFTNPHTNLCGCYEISMKQMAYETGLTIKKVSALIRRLSETHDVIRYCEATKEVLILKWHKYNWTKSEKFRIPLSKEIESVKCVEFSTFLTEILNGNDTVSIPYGYGSDTRARTVSVSDTVTVSDTVSDSVTDTESVTEEYYGEFNNVKLSDEEYEKLVSRFPMDYQEKIEELSAYLKNTDRKYKSHYATILSWDRRAKKDKKPEQSDISRWEVDF